MALTRFGKYCMLEAQCIFQSLGSKLRYHYILGGAAYLPPCIQENRILLLFGSLEAVCCEFGIGTMCSRNLSTSTFRKDFCPERK